MTKALIFYDLFWNDNRSIKLTLVVATKNYFYFGHPFNVDIIKNCARATKFKLMTHVFLERLQCNFSISLLCYIIET